MENWHRSQAGHFNFRPCEWVVQCPKIVKTTVYSLSLSFFNFLSVQFKYNV